MLQKSEISNLSGMLLRGLEPLTSRIKAEIDSFVFRAQYHYAIGAYKRWMAKCWY